MKKFLAVVVFLSFCFLNLSEPKCVPKTFPGPDNNSVCVCNSSFCDAVEEIEILPGNLYVYESTLSGKRLELRKNQPNVSLTSISITVKINSKKRFQKLFGFGGAFTDSTGINLFKLSKNTQKKLLYSYFNPNGGIGYTFGRVPMASTDFSTRIYSYDDVAEDFELKNFKLQEEDFKYKILFIKDANLISGNKLKLVGTPWSAPGWMKASKNMTGIGGLIGDVKGKYYSTWANYFIKFLKEYAKAGVKFWGITIQNEPSSGLLPHYYWQTMSMDAKTQAAFVRLHLKPALDKSVYANKLKIMAHDDNRPGLLTAALEIMNDREGAKSIDGYAVHWYMDDYGHLSRLNETHDLDESKFILNTEACNGFRSPLRGVWLGSWARAERYAKDIIETLNNWSTGWIDWNLCLDVEGGPTWAKNYVDSPIIVIPQNDTFYKQPMFYAMGAFSRFIPPDSLRLHSWTDDTNYKDLSFTSFITPQNSTVLVLLNRGNNDISLTIDDIEKAATKTVSLASRSITTILWNSLK